MDLGFTNHIDNQTSYQTGGEWGVFGTHTLNCKTGISMFNNSNMNYYGIMEQTPDSNKGGDGIVIDADLDDKAVKSILAGSINNFDRGVVLGDKAANNRALANISNTNAPIVTTSNSLPKTLILTPVNYAGTGTAIGTQIPTDITIPGEAKPLAPAVGSRRIYVDSTSGDLSVERSDETVVDLEAPSKLLFYKEAVTSITGDGTDKTVYTFSIPSIPAGAGIRARVFWQCTSSTGGNKTFKWNFGGTLGTTTAYNSYNSSNTTDVAYTEVRIFNNSGARSPQTLFGDPIVLGTTMVSAGILASPNRNTATSQPVSFLFNAPSSETIAPKGFILEAIQ